MSARLRLTLSYVGFLVVAGAALMAIGYTTLRFVPEGNLTGPAGFVPDREDLLRTFVPRALIALAGLAVVGFAGGWVLAGRMLRPLDRIGAVAREVAAGSLDHRVQLDGPRDEFRLLADTFDGMLDRVQALVGEQQRFAVNAAHELRTPHAVAQAIIDLALADPEGRDVDEVLRRLDRTNRRGSDVVEALLALSALGAGQAIARVPVDVGEVAAAVVEELRPAADAAGIAVTAELDEADTDGHPTLVRQLVANLVGNAIAHNSGPGGRVEVRTAADEDGAVELRVRNTGPVVAPALLPTLTEPFVRGAGRVAAAGSSGGGSGLGLALVARVVAAHGAEMRIEAPPDGGLDVRVTFPPPADGPGAAVQG